MNKCMCNIKLIKENGRKKETEEEKELNII